MRGRWSPQTPSATTHFGPFGQGVLEVQTKAIVNLLKVVLGLPYPSPASPENQPQRHFAIEMVGYASQSISKITNIMNHQLEEEFATFKFALSLADASKEDLQDLNHSIKYIASLC